MTEPTETVEEPKVRFTEIRQFVAGDRFIGFASCLECGAGVFIDAEDRKNDIHPMALHIRWHEDVTETLNEVEGFAEATERVLTNVVGGNKPEFWEGNKDEFTKEATDSGRQVQRTTPDASDDQRSGVEAQVPPTDDVPERGQVGTNRPQGSRPGPVPGVPGQGRGKGQGNAGGPRPQH